jgi:TonB-dependent starch-binding outer membrane protein SusC
MNIKKLMLPLAVVLSCAGALIAAAKSPMNGKTAVSLAADTTVKPLYVIDGVVFNGKNIRFKGSTLAVPKGASPFDVLKKEDIVSVEALKDADATAIYGAKAANGVILITTKTKKSH